MILDFFTKISRSFILCQIGARRYILKSQNVRIRENKRTRNLTDLTIRENKYSRIVFFCLIKINTRKN